MKTRILVGLAVPQGIRSFFLEDNRGRLRPALIKLGYLLATVATAAQGQLPADASLAEQRAGEAIKQYYDSTVREASRRSVIATDHGSQRRDACRGTSLWDCFGGDLWCAWRAPWCDPRQYGAERDLLLQALDSLAAAEPSSDFIAGQYVDFALKDGNLDRAWNIAEGCRATGWWCQALRGYVLNRMGAEPGRAYAALDSARTGAHEEATAWGLPVPLAPDRGLDCEWHDVGHLIEDQDLRERYEGSPCGQQHPLSLRYWFLSDPLWSVPGNARHEEHIVRHIQMRLLYQAQVVSERPPTISEPRPFWPQALHAQWIRFGFYNSWRTATEMRGGEEVDRPELYVNGGYSFGPDAALMRQPELSARTDWMVDWDDDRERMLTNEAWHNFRDYQAGVMRRSDAFEIVAAGRLPVLIDSIEHVSAALAVADPDRLEVLVVPASVSASGVVRAVASVGGEHRLISLELAGKGWRGRSRHGASLPALDRAGFGLSDPLLVLPSDEDAPLVDRILPSTRVFTDLLGVYFEVYGVGRDEPLEIRVSLERAERSLAQRILGVFGLGTGGPSAQIEWEEAASTEHGRASRDVLLNVAGLEGGDYQLAVQIALGDGRTARATRTITLVKVD